MSRAIVAWLTSENLATLAAEAPLSVESCITQVFEDAGWKVEIEAHVTGPLSSPPRQGASGICLWGTGARFLEPTWPLARGLKKKAARYEVKGPLVLAVSPINDGIDHEDIEPALYGPMWVSEAWDGTVTMRREGGGLWMNKDRTIRNKSISAVIVCPNIFPATVGSVTPVCYQCPEPRHPLHDLLPRGSQATLDDIHVSYRAGLSGRQYFGLHEDWPRARL